MDRRYFLNKSVAIAGASAVSAASAVVAGCGTTTGTTTRSSTAGKQKVPFFLVDAFTDKPFAGNPAPVVVLPAWLPDSTMQSLAAEMNMSEVAYVVNKNDRQWDIRWFTPVREVPLNGHATLAAASVVFETIDRGAQKLTFNAKSGQLTVERDGEAFLMNFPADPEPKQVEVPREAEADLGVKPSEYWVNARNVAVYKNAAEVKAVVSKITKATTWTQGRHLMITAPGDSGTDYVLRYFVPILNIPEDPVSGVVHCTLVPFWAKRLNKTKFNVAQLSSRGGNARTGLDASGRVLIGGPCARYVEGTLFI